MPRRPGEVRDAIFSYFTQHKNATTATLTQIREHVRRKLGDDVASSSIRSFMQLSKDFERVGRGEYKKVG